MIMWWTDPPGKLFQYRAPFPHTQLKHCQMTISLAKIRGKSKNDRVLLQVPVGGGLAAW